MEKGDLLPFEEAKLYGHNAVHALLGFIGTAKGHEKMTEVKNDSALMKIAKDAFLNESGSGLIAKYSHIGDEFFTEAGCRNYAEDLLRRITNPYLADTTARTSRDIVRKLGCSDRIFGTMRLALEYGIEPTNMAVGAAAGVYLLLSEPKENNLPDELAFDWKTLTIEQIEKLLTWLWQGQGQHDCSKVAELINQAVGKLRK